MPGAKCHSSREGCDASRMEEGFRGGGYVGASAKAAVAASAPGDPAELFLNGIPHCEQNRAARSASEPHCWHRSICNGSHNSFDMLSRLESLVLNLPVQFHYGKPVRNVTEFV